MTRAVEAANRLAAAWAGVAGAVAWQAAVVVGLVGLAAIACRRSSPGVRCWLWQVAALKLAVMPFWGIALAVPAWSAGVGPAIVMPAAGPAAGTLVHPTAGRGSVPPRPEVNPAGAGATHPGPLDWRVGVMVGWAILVVGQLAGLARHRHRLARVLARATPATDPELLGMVAELAARVGLRRPPRVLLGAAGGSPFVCDALCPALVLPADLARTVEGEGAGFAAVLLHELAHLRRRDLIWGWLPAVARLVCAGHPAAYFVAARVRLERELACDQAAMLLAGQGAPGYAATLIAVVARRAARPPAA